MSLCPIVPAPRAGRQEPHVSRLQLPDPSRELPSLAITGAALRMRRREWDEASAAKAPALSSPITSLLLAAEHTFTYERCYLEKQPYLDAFRRAHLLDWLVHVGDRLRVHEETSFLAVVYFDRFVERVEIALHAGGSQRWRRFFSLSYSCARLISNLISQLIRT